MEIWKRWVLYLGIVIGAWLWWFASSGEAEIVRYPYRSAAPWVVAGGAVLYLLIPRPRKDPEAIRFPLWKIALGDFTLAAMFGLLFLVPLWVAGGSRKAFTDGYLIVVAVCWLLAAAVMWAARRMVPTFTATMRVADDGLHVANGERKAFYAFQEMASLHPGVLKESGGIAAAAEVGSVVAALSGDRRAAHDLRGSAASSRESEEKMWILRLKDGSDVFLREENSPPGIEDILEALRKAVGPPGEEAKAAKGFFGPDNGFRDRWRKGPLAFPLFALLQAAALGVAAGILVLIG